MKISPGAGLWFSKHMVQSRSFVNICHGSDSTQAEQERQPRPHQVRVSGIPAHRRQTHTDQL